MIGRLTEDLGGSVDGSGGRIVERESDSRGASAIVGAHVHESAVEHDEVTSGCGYRVALSDFVVANMGIATTNSVVRERVAKDGSAMRARGDSQATRGLVGIGERQPRRNHWRWRFKWEDGGVWS
jgi:hypothetical protein